MKRAKTLSALISTIIVFSVILMTSLVMSQGEFTTSRDISKQVNIRPGETITVTITVDVAQDVTALALDEDLPSGWTVTPVDNGGAIFRPSEVQWLWLSASAGYTKTVIYNVTVPSDAVEGTYDLTGNISATGVSPEPIGGESTVSVGIPPIVTNASANPSTITVDTEITELRVDVADRESRIGAVTIDLSPIGGNESTIMSNIGSYTQGGLLWIIYNYSTNSSVVGTFNLTVNATDIFGNYNDTVSIPLEVVAGEDWNPWDNPDSEEGATITLNEIIEAIACWANDEPINGHTITLEEIIELISIWAAG